MNEDHPTKQIGEDELLAMKKTVNLMIRTYEELHKHPRNRLARWLRRLADRIELRSETLAHIDPNAKFNMEE